MGSLYESLKKKLENNLEVYKTQPERINSDWHREDRTKSEYNGRQLYELLQNAEDAIVSQNDGSVFISFEKNVLKICNNGEPFTLEGFSSLLLSDNSPKEGRGKIGNKGLGFRSILNWGEEVRVYSAGVGLAFSEEIAFEQLDKLLLEPTVKRYFENNGKEKRIAVLAAPKLIDYVDTGYVTTVEIDVRSHYKNSVIEQLKQLSSLDLLFLRKIKELVIKTDVFYNAQFIKKTLTSINEFIECEEVCSLINNVGDSSKYSIYRKQGEKKIFNKERNTFENKCFEIALAYENGVQPKSHYLYNFFRTNIKLPFGIIINCTFELTSDRNNILSDNDTNKEMMSELEEAFIYFLEILAPTFEDKFNILKTCKVYELNALDYTLSNDYSVPFKRAIEKAKILPCYGDVFLSKADGVTCNTTYEYAKMLQFNDRDKVLLYSQDRVVQQSLISLSLPKIPIQIVKKAIDQVSVSLSAKQKAELLYYYIANYKDDKEYAGNVPYLLVDNSGIPIKNEKIFVSGSDGKDLEKLINLPSFVNFKFLNFEQIEVLRKFFHCDARNLTYDNKFPGYQLQDYEMKDILKACINCISTMENLKEFIQWLVDNAEKVEVVKTEILNGFGLELINAQGQAMCAKDLYFTSDYGYDITDKIIRTVAQDRLLVSPQMLGLQDVDINVLIKLFKHCGVCEYPKPIQENIESEEKIKSFAKYLTEKGHKFIFSGQNFEFKDNEFVKTTTDGYSYQAKCMKVETIEFLEEIIEKIDYETIMMWMISDSNFKNWIEDDRSNLTTISIIRNYYKQILTEEIKYSYIKYVFSTSKWVQTLNGKVAPVNCCLENVDMSPYIEMPISIDASKYPDRPSLTSNVEYKLTLLGAVRDLKNLSPSVLYSILLNLHKQDPQCKQTHKLYKKVVQAKFNKDVLSNCKEHNQFVSNGFVACKKNGKKCYKPITEVYYSNDRIYSEDLISNFYILDLDKRCGELNVEGLFGVKPLKSINISVSNIINSTVNQEFQKELENFKPYIYIICKNNDRNIQDSAIRSIKIELVTQITATYQHNEYNKEYAVKDYDSILTHQNNVNIYYIKVPTNIDLEYLKNNVTFCDIIAEIIAGALKIESDRQDYRELFSKTIEERNILLSRDADDYTYFNELLDHACEVFKIVHDLENEFWLNVAKLSDSTEKIANMREKYASLIDYRKLNDLVSLKYIAEIFGQLNITVKSFNALCDKKIDGTQYVFNIVRELRDRYSNKYRCYLLQQLDKGVIVDNQVKNCLSQYNNWQFHDKTILRRDEIEAIFFAELNIDKDVLESIDDKDIESIEKALDIDTSLKTIENQNVIQQQNTYQYDYTNIAELAKEMRPEEIVVFDNNIHEPKDTIASKNKSVDLANKAQNDKETGKYAEHLVYQMLLLDKNIKDVKGCSANFENGTDGLGYDLTYCDIKTGETYFVEVKGSRNEKSSFVMTQNEVAVSMADPHHYVIYLVLNISENEKIKPKYVVLNNLFDLEEGQSFTNNEKFQISNESYKIFLKENYNKKEIDS